MIILPARRKLIARRDYLYEHLISITSCCSVHQMEDIMRQIHGLNMKIKTYFAPKPEPEEIFND